MNIQKKYVTYGILLVVLFIMSQPWLQEGVPATDDYRHHASRVWFVEKQFEAQTFSEWNPYMYGGWPVLTFYHPLFYVFATPFIAVFETIAVLKILTIAAFALSLFGTFYAGKLLFKDEDIAVFAAVAYSLSSHFLFHATVSGALPRLVAIGLVPLSMALFIQALHSTSKKNTAYAILPLVVLLLTHLSVALPVFVILGVLALYTAYEQKNVKILVQTAATFGIVLLIGAAWLIPMLMEKQYANFSESTVLEGAYLEQTSRTFGIINDGSKFIRSNYFGYSIMILAAMSLFFVKKDRTLKLLSLGFVVSGLCYFNFLSILQYIPLMKTAVTNSTTFFIAAWVFTAVMLAGVAAKGIAKNFNKQYLIYILLIIAVIDLQPGVDAFSYGWMQQPTEDFTNPPPLIDAWKWIDAQEGMFGVISLYGQAAEIYHNKQEFGFDWVGCPQCVPRKTYELHNEIWSNLSKGIKDDSMLGYLGVKYYVGLCSKPLTNTTAYNNGAVCIYENTKFKSALVASQAEITDEELMLEKITFTATAQESTEVIIKQNHFKPHWHAYVDGKEVPITTAWPEFMSIQVPAGTHAISIEYKTNAIHIGAWLLSLLTVVCLVRWMRT